MSGFGFMWFENGRPCPEILDSTGNGETRDRSEQERPGKDDRGGSRRGTGRGGLTPLQPAAVKLEYSSSDKVPAAPVLARESQVPRRERGRRAGGHGGGSGVGITPAPAAPRAPYGVFSGGSLGQRSAPLPTIRTDRAVGHICAGWRYRDGLGSGEVYSPPRALSTTSE